jgi:hypothetical protein
MYKDKEKQKQFNREWVAKRRKEWIDKNGPCKCGSSDRLQVDHIDPATKVSHRVWSWSDTRRNAELAKCQVLCYACHKTKTLQQRRKATHGGSQFYNKGCRCEPCVLYNRNRNRQQRLKARLAERPIAPLLQSGKP